MENASKALLMAGGILIAIITIALLVRTTGTVSLFQKNRLSEEEQAQLVTFNEQYTKYLGQHVYGTEVITTINKAINDKKHEITVTILFETAYTYDTYEYEKGKKKIKTNTVSAGKELNITNNEDIAYRVIDQITKENDALQRRAFKCTDIGYDSYGRVNSIKFEEKKWGSLY